MAQSKGASVTTEPLHPHFDQPFAPKDRDDVWRAAFGVNTSSGYDFMLVIENPETGVSYEIELGVLSDGRLGGQVTPFVGNRGGEAMFVFDVSTNSADISDPSCRQELHIEGGSVGTEPKGHAVRPRGFY
jgi:hypothetical protein